MYFKISISAPQPLWEQWNLAKCGWKFCRMWLNWPDAGHAVAGAEIRCIPVFLPTVTRGN